MTRRLDYRMLQVRNTGATVYIPRKRGCVTLILEIIAAIVFIIIIIYHFFPTEEANLDWSQNNNLPYSDIKSEQVGKLNQMTTTQQTFTERTTIGQEPLVNTDISEPPLSTGDLWKEPTILNLRNFSWTVVNESRCQQPEGVNKRIVPILIHTDRKHFNERDAIRKTYTSIRDSYENWDVRPVFLLAESVQQKNRKRAKIEEKGLYAEQQLYGDIVIGNFLDTYRNLIYKHLMGYKWILNFCPNAFFVVKTDDDMFINLLDWFEWRNEDYKKFDKNRSEVIPDMYCMTYGGTWPMRDPQNKWYVSKKEWPEEYYPDYCSGNAYGITVEAIRKIYSGLNVNKFVWVDDAFVTGIVRRKVERKIGRKFVIRDVWANVTAKMEDWRPFCEERKQGLDHWIKLKPFKSIVNMPRDQFARDMICLWKKALFDRKITPIVDKLNRAKNDSLYQTLF